MNWYELNIFVCPGRSTGRTQHPNFTQQNKEPGLALLDNQMTLVSLVQTVQTQKKEEKKTEKASKQAICGNNESAKIVWKEPRTKSTPPIF